ncbi:hypothetical protein HNQ39_002211 [Armatimonas rosea]|uniref:Uncharacterized protein n=1 Tax=Armatimonas rosea TaxID=685828 RepID=A0A7W9SPI9_ARMRO|nr:hypothetical protein [Armatimonas rosea]
MIGATEKVEEHLCLSVKVLQRAGIAAGYQGSITWWRTSSFEGRKQTNWLEYEVSEVLHEDCHRPVRLTLKYLIEGCNYRVPLDFDWTPCHYGGYRPWLNCPTCHVRSGTLFYVSWELWECRRCLNLAYTCQSEGHKSRLLRKILKLRGQLGQESGGIHAPLPLAPPPGWHSRRFNKKIREIIVAEANYWKG